MSKTFTLNSIIPRISSITKTDSAPARVAQPKRTNGRVVTTGSARSLTTATKTRSRSFGSGWVSFASAFGLVVAVVGLGFYVYAINASASKGYEFKRQQAVVDELLETNKRLTIQQAALGSIVKVNDVAATSGMVPVVGEEFLVASQLSNR